MDSKSTDLSRVMLGDAPFEEYFKLAMKESTLHMVEKAFGPLPSSAKRNSKWIHDGNRLSPE